MVLTVTEEEYQQMEMALMDADKDEALRLVRIFAKRLKEQKQQEEYLEIKLTGNDSKGNHRSAP